MLNPINALRRASQAIKEVKNDISRNSYKEGDDIYDYDGFINSNAKTNVNLSIKGTPSKDARTTMALALKNSSLMKRNEQGVWQKRQICILNHMFLYYYENENSDLPKGVIDLHLYQDLSIEGNDMNILKLTPPEGTGLRSFYFQSDDPNDLSDLITSLHRDRYETIKDERDAYVQLQVQFSGEMNSNKKNLESSTLDKERILNQLEVLQKDNENALKVLQRILAIVGITDEEMEKLKDVYSAGDTLITTVNEMKSRLESNVDIIEQERSNDRIKFQSTIDNNEKQILIEQQKQQKLEQQLIQQKKDFELQLRESTRQLDHAELNIQMSVTSKKSVDEKNIKLNEARKILVKEVKTLRKKLEQSVITADQLKEMNDRLSSSLASIQENQSNDHSNNNNNSRSSSFDDNKNITNDKSSSISNQLNGRQEDSDDEYDDSGNPGDPNATAKDVERYNSRLSWEMSSSSLKELGWLSPEQLNFVNSRKEDVVIDKNNSNLLFPDDNSSISNQVNTSNHQSSNMLQLSDNNNNNTNATTTTTTTTTTTSDKIDKISSTLRRGSLAFGSMTSSLFQKDKVSTSSVLEINNSSNDLLGLNSISNTNYKEKESSSLSSLSSIFGGIDNNDNSEKRKTSSSFFDSPVSEENNHSSSAERSNVLRCLRCDGTVEGPKYSTCKCKIPAFSADDLKQNVNGSSIFSLPSMFKNDSNSTSSITKDISNFGDRIFSKPSFFNSSNDNNNNSSVNGT